MNLDRFDASSREKERKRLSNEFQPARASVLALALVIAVGTVLLMLPVARSGATPWQGGEAVIAGPSFSGGAPLSVAVFTATSATCVTGLIVADTATYWSTFGQVVLTILMEIGGLGTMTFGALMALVVAKRLNLKQRIVIASATGAVTLRDVRGVALRIVRYGLSFQAVLAIPIFIDLIRSGEPFRRALGHSVFLSISAFNNAGFSVYSDSLMSKATSPLVIIPISLLIIIGGLGFPVLLEFRRALTDRSRAMVHWSLNTRLVIFSTAFLILFGWICVGFLEWNNHRTLGGMNAAEKLLVTFFTAVSPRTAGFNAMDISQQSDVTWVVTELFMFVGAGPAGTAGGVKVTTALVLIFMVLTEIRAGRSVHLFGARIGRSVHRQATTVLVLSFSLLIVSTILILGLTPYSLDRVLFEVVSAMGTVGLSTGITQTLPISAQIILCILMFFGRVGPVTIAAVLAVKPDTRLWELPKERPLIG